MNLHRLALCAELRTSLETFEAAIKQNTDKTVIAAHKARLDELVKLLQNLRNE